VMGAKERAYEPLFIRGKGKEEDRKETARI
jgi:hypothetical protein